MQQPKRSPEGRRGQGIDHRSMGREGGQEQDHRSMVRGVPGDQDGQDK